MAVKNTVFGKNWIGSDVTSMKITFFPFLTHILVPPGSNMEFLEQNFNFQSLRRSYILTNYVPLGLT